jgi:hypothetical protein
LTRETRPTHSTRNIDLARRDEINRGEQQHQPGDNDGKKRRRRPNCGDTTSPERAV